MQYIKFENQTYAQKACMLLKQNSIPCSVKRNPNPDFREGCNFALFAGGNIQKAYALISSSGIPNLGIARFGEG